VVVVVGHRCSLLVCLLPILIWGGLAFNFFLNH
jgi:hypothetical protein